MAWTAPRNRVGRAWRIQRRWALAAAVAVFPALFVLDEAVDTGLSPVLPGLAVLLLAWLAAPYVLMELRSRTPWQKARLQKEDVSSKYALGAAAAWFLLWLVFG